MDLLVEVDSFVEEEAYELAEDMDGLRAGSRLNRRAGGSRSASSLSESKPSANTSRMRGGVSRSKSGLGRGSPI